MKTASKRLVLCIFIALAAWGAASAPVGAKSGTSTTAGDPAEIYGIAFDLRNHSAQSTVKPGFSVTEKRFFFHSNLNNFKNKFDVTVWGPKSDLVIDYAGTPAISIYFHGLPTTSSNHLSCSITVNCQGGNCFKQSSPWDPKLYTGLDDAKSIAPKCPNTPYYGISMGATSNSSENGYKGVGALTYTGPNRAIIDSAFFQPLASFIQGTYIHFLVADHGIMKPFSAECQDNCEQVMRVWTKQVVKTAQTVNYGVVNGKESGTQAQQKMVTLLHNVGPDGKDEGRIEFTPYTFCQGIYCDRQHATFNVDPKQGNIFYVGGPLLGGGESTELAKSGITAWTSYGSGTQNQPFDTTWFHYEITWTNFKAMLEYLATQDKDGRDIHEIFGEDWDDPQAWQLKQYRFAQEVYNPLWADLDANNVAYIGGHTSWVQIDAIGK